MFAGPLPAFAYHAGVMFDAISRELSAMFDPKSIAAAIGEWMPKLGSAALTLLFFWVLWRLAGRALRRMEARKVLDATAMAFVGATVKYAIGILGVVTALARLGIDTSSVIASLGIAGLTLGFAARDSLSNVISGIFIFWDRPFVIGDLVEINGQYGRVETITMRSTRIVTVDGKMLAIPNATVANGTVVSYTNFPHLRVDIAVTLGVEEDLGRARRLLLELAEAHPARLAERSPRVVVTALNDYNVAVELRMWISDERDHLDVRWELREQVFEALRTAGVDMPYETLTIREMAA